MVSALVSDTANATDFAKGIAADDFPTLDQCGGVNKMLWVAPQSQLVCWDADIAPAQYAVCKSSYRHGKKERQADAQ